jgi:hypothetical protein
MFRDGSGGWNLPGGLGGSENQDPPYEDERNQVEIHRLARGALPDSSNQ